MNATGHVWIVQTRERTPIEFPPEDSLVMYQNMGRELTKSHPCVKPPEEMAFLIKHLTEPGQIVLDCCCGLGSTLVSAKLMQRR